MQEKNMASWELTYPIPVGTFGDDSGTCDPSLEGFHPQCDTNFVIWQKSEAYLKTPTKPSQKVWLDVSGGNAKEPAADGATNSPEEAAEPPAGADSEAAAAAWEPWHRWDLMVEVLTFNGNLLKKNQHLWFCCCCCCCCSSCCCCCSCSCCSCSCCSCSCSCSCSCCCSCCCSWVFFLVSSGWNVWIVSCTFTPYVFFRCEMLVILYLFRCWFWFRSWFEWWEMLATPFPGAG